MVVIGWLLGVVAMDTKWSTSHGARGRAVPVGGTGHWWVVPVGGTGHWWVVPVGGHVGGTVDTKWSTSHGARGGWCLFG